MGVGNQSDIGVLYVEHILKIGTQNNHTIQGDESTFQDLKTRGAVQQTTEVGDTSIVAAQ